ncbi:MAG: hypothetical protein ACLU9R_04075 [Faecalibacterium sp.]
MGFFKQKGHSKRFLRSIAICCGFMGIEASKPSGYPDGESMRWNVVLFRSIFAIVFVGIVSRLSSDYKSFRCMESNTRQCQSNNISGTSEICAVRKSKKLLLSQSWQVVF